MGAGVRERQVGGDLEADAQVALALREPRRVDGEDDGAAAGGGGLGEMVASRAAVLEDVELAPLHDPRGGGRDLLVRACRERRDGDPGAGRRGAARRRALGLGVVELLVGDRRDDDRQLNLAAEHRRGRRDLRHVAEHAGTKRPAGEGGAASRNVHSSPEPPTR